MNARRCGGAEAGTGGRDARSWWRRGGEVAGWVIPSAALALLPKCPACVAAYVAVATGIGISLPVAACLRFGLVAVCAGALVFLAVRRLRGARTVGA